MRTRRPALRTLPSSTWLALSCRATCSTSTFLPLNAKAVFLAATQSAEILLRSVMTSSVMPSEKYSCSASPLMFANGRTHTPSRCDLVTTGSADRPGIFSAVCGWSVEPGLVLPVATDAAFALDNTSRRTSRSMISGGSCPRCRRIHWRSRNRSGTRAAASGVSSITNGSRNGWSSAMRCVRSTASFHSSRK